MSFVSAPAASARCVRCDDRRVTSIAMTLTDGSPVHFVSCHKCEHRRWLQDGVELDRSVVLAKAQKHKVPPR